MIIQQSMGIEFKVFLFSDHSIKIDSFKRGIKSLCYKNPLTKEVNLLGCGNIIECIFRI